MSLIQDMSEETFGGASPFVSQTGEDFRAVASL